MTILYLGPCLYIGTDPYSTTYLEISVAKGTLSAHYRNFRVEFSCPVLFRGPSKASNNF